MSDSVNHPQHYTSHPSGVECIALTENLGFCLGNAIKYIFRHKMKGKPVEDLKKALWYVNHELKRRYAKDLMRSEPPIIYGHEMRTLDEKSLMSRVIRAEGGVGADAMAFIWAAAQNAIDIESLRNALWCLNEAIALTEWQNERAS